MTTATLASVDVTSEDMKLATSASFETELSKLQGVPALPPLFANNAVGLCGNNDQRNNGWAPKAAYHPTQQPLDGKHTETILHKTWTPAWRGDSRVRPCSCPSQPDSL